MPLVYSSLIIRRAQDLLALPASQDQTENAERQVAAQRLITQMNLYYLSPVFILSGGCNLQSLLETKYAIKNSMSCCDLLMMPITTAICDEAVVISSMVVFVYLMTLLWLPAWRASAYASGYQRGNNKVYGKDHGEWPAQKYAVWNPPVIPVCFCCNQTLYWTEGSNGTYSYQVALTTRCNAGSIYCPSMTQNTTLHFVLKEANKGNRMIVDKSSFHNSTYMTYLMDGDLPMEIDGIMCNQTLQGQLEGFLAMQSVKTPFIWSVIGITTGMVIAYIILNAIMACFHSCKEDIDPSSYEIVRIHKPTYSSGMIINAQA